MSSYPNLKNQLQELLTPQLFLAPHEYNAFLALVNKGKLTKKENPVSHCDVMFVPFNPKNQKIFIVNHKKAKQWIVPGGHIEEGELLEDAVKREIQEELGLTLTEIEPPFLCSVITIHNEGQPCKTHYDIWYRLPTTKKVSAEMREFNETRWVTLQEAKKLIKHRTYLEALKKLFESNKL